MYGKFASRCSSDIKLRCDRHMQVTVHLYSSSETLVGLIENIEGNNHERDLPLRLNRCVQNRSFCGKKEENYESLREGSFIPGVRLL